jgi:hypothetical protein
MCIMTVPEAVSYCFDDNLNNLFDTINNWSTLQRDDGLRKGYCRFLEEFSEVKSAVERTKRYSYVDETHFVPLVDKVTSLSQRFSEFIQFRDLYRYGLL